MRTFSLSLLAPLIQSMVFMTKGTILLGLLAQLTFAADTPPTIQGESFKTSAPPFQTPYVDTDEWRDRPVRHRYIHGGFEGTTTRFSFYFPPKDQYEGRFFQYITPVPDSETLSQGAVGEEDKIRFALENGAYFVETNGGGAEPGQGTDPTIGAYRANAAAAQYSRILAQRLYQAERPFGYAFGGSGGAYRTIAGFENTENVWDGVVPFVMGTPMALPNVFTVRAYAMRVLDGKFDAIANAVDVGADTSPYTGLSDEQASALKEVTQMGFPLAAWRGHETLGLHAYAIIYPQLLRADPSYFKDFWTKPGYEGHNPTPSLKAAQIQKSTHIKRLITAEQAHSEQLSIDPLAGEAKGRADDAWKALQSHQEQGLPAAIELATPDSLGLLGSDLQVKSGEAKGQQFPMMRVKGNTVFLNVHTAKQLKGIQAGDKVFIDNSNYLAAQTYHRHQVPGPEYSVWDQFRDEQGNPMYPQRPMLLGPLFTRGAAGHLPTGQFDGKMIVIQNLYDTEAFPWQAHWYREKVESHFGESIDDHYRLWFLDHANHGDFSQQKDPTLTISYLGALQQALLDLSAWVEKGVPPADSTQYAIENGQVTIPSEASTRRGIQPVVSVTADGQKRLISTPGDRVTLRTEVDVPPGAGDVIEVEWDFEGDGKYDVTLSPDEIVHKDGKWIVVNTHHYHEAGTHFPTVRVSVHRTGDTDSVFERIRNLGRARVIVRSPNS